MAEETNLAEVRDSISRFSARGCTTQKDLIDDQRTSERASEGESDAPHRPEEQYRNVTAR